MLSRQRSMSADTVSPTRKRVRLSTLPPSESSSPAGLGIGQPDCSVYERPKPSLLDFDVRALQSSFPTPESSPDELETFCERSNVDSGTAPRLRRNLTSRAVARLRDVKPIPSSAVKPNDSSKDRLVAGLIGPSISFLLYSWMLTFGIQAHRFLPLNQSGLRQRATEPTTAMCYHWPTLFAKCFDVLARLARRSNLRCTTCISRATTYEPASRTSKPFITSFTPPTV